MDTNHSRSPVNGRISSGYHSEDDAYMNGRTTPTIEALPGLLAGSDSDTDNDSIDPSMLRLVICFKPFLGPGFHMTV
jgi:hypothetical protein